MFDNTLASEAFGTDTHTHSLGGFTYIAYTHTHRHSHLKISHTVLQVPQ